MKEARRREAKEQRAMAPPPPPGIDPDIAGITPGPQPLADWQQEMLEEEEATAAEKADE